MNECSSPSESSPSAVAAAAATGDTTLLIPNLPDDVALQCIARVPFLPLYHIQLSLVSKSWRSMLSSPLFFSTRRRLNCIQNLLYLDVYIEDSSKWFALDLNSKNPRNLSPVPPVPSQPMGSTFAVLGPRIYVLGGYIEHVPSSSVWIFDCRFNRWEIGPNMHVERVSAAAGVLNGKIYVIGGYCHGFRLQSTYLAEVFDPALGSWALIPNPPQIRYTWMAGGVVLKEKFFAMTDQGGVVFDPCDSSWRYIPSALKNWSNCRGRICMVNGILCSCDLLGEIRGFDGKEGKWKELIGLKKNLSQFLYEVRMVNVGGRLCVVWEERETEDPGNETKISCAEVEVGKDCNGGLWGSVVWSQVILRIPTAFALGDCLGVEL